MHAIGHLPGHTAANACHFVWDHFAWEQEYFVLLGLAVRKAT